MKKSNFLLGAAAALAMGAAFTSCSDDDIKGIDNGKVEHDQTRYLSIALCTPPSGSRAADDAPTGQFNDGAPNESAVNKLIFVFYDGAGYPTATSKSYSTAELKEGWTENYGNGNVTRFWNYVVPVELVQGQEVPSYVMCYVNPIDETNLTTMNLTEIDGIKRKDIKKAVTVGEGDAATTTTFFAMSNSVYYGNNPITGQTNVRMMATPILEGNHLFGTREAAEKALKGTTPEGTDANKEVLEIYVERYAAKTGVNMTPGAIETYAVNQVTAVNATTGVPSVTATTIKFTPTFWHPNAIDLETYVTKAFSTGATTMDPTVASPYTDMVTAFTGTGMANTWNDSDNFRSYWACSPSFYANAYPVNSDDITDNANWKTTFPFALRYFTYNQIKNGVEGEGLATIDKGIAWDATNGFSAVPGNQTTAVSGYFYSRETTASIRNITSPALNNKAVVASVVIVGKYHLGTSTTDETFYLYGVENGNPNYYSETNVNMLKQAMIATQSVIFSDVNGTVPVTNINNFELIHPTLDVRGDENVPGRLVTLQLTGTDENMYYYNGTAYTPIATDADLIAANRLLWKSVSTAQMFYNGLAFFSIPIRHLGFGGGTIPADKPLLDGAGGNKYNWENMRRGDFGVVRNHVYTINVTKISGLGTGLRSEDQPIVPPADPDNYYIAAKLNILSWRVVPAQGVEL